MRINKIAEHYNNKKIAFKSIRTDKNTVGVLQNGTNPIGENQKLNILTSLNNLANSPERQNIEFLLGVADNIVYGQNGNSKFKDALDEDSQTPSLRENTDWSKLLEETISKAIKNSDGEDFSDLEAEASRILVQKKN